MGEGVAPAIGPVAVDTVMYDRHAKRARAGLEERNATAYASDFDEPDHMADAVGVTRGR